MPPSATKAGSNRISRTGILIPKKDIRISAQRPDPLDISPPLTLYAGRPYVWKRLSIKTILITTERETQIKWRDKYLIKIAITPYFVKNVRVFHGRLSL